MGIYPAHLYFLFDTYKEIETSPDLNINNLVNKLSKFALTEKFLFLLRLDINNINNKYSGLPLECITLMLEMKEKYLSLKIIFPLIEQLRYLNFEVHLEKLGEKDSFSLKLELFGKENKNAIEEFEHSEEVKKIIDEMNKYYIQNYQYLYSFHYLYISIFIYAFKDTVLKYDNKKRLNENYFVNDILLSFFNKQSLNNYHLQNEELNLVIDYLKKNNSFNHIKNITQIILLQLNLSKYIKEKNLYKKFEKNFFEKIFGHMFDNNLSNKIRWTIYKEEINKINFNEKFMEAILEGIKTKEELLTYNIFENINQSKTKNGLHISTYRSIFTNEKIIIIKIGLEYYKKNKIFLEENEIKSEINSIQKSSDIKGMDYYIQIDNKIINFTDSYDLFIKELKEKNIIASKKDEGKIKIKEAPINENKIIGKKMQNENNIFDNKEKEELKELLSKEKNNNQKLSEEINKLKSELKEEKNKNKEHEKTIKNLKNNLDNEKKKFDDLKESIEKEKIIKNKFRKESKESFLDAIMEKDKEIKDLKLKLSRYPFELMEGERLMVVIIRSNDQKIDYAFICKNSDKFRKIEEQLYDIYSEYADYEVFFTFNGTKINKNKTLEENNIKNNDIIILNVFD